MVVTSTTAQPEEPPPQQDQTVGFFQSGLVKGIGSFVLLFSGSFQVRACFARLVCSLEPAPRHLKQLCTNELKQVLDGYTNQFKHLLKNRFRGFGTWFSLMLGNEVLTDIVQEQLQMMVFDPIVDCQPIDKEERNHRWLFSKLGSLAVSGLLLFPLDFLCELCLLDRTPPLRQWISQSVLRGQNYFYAPILLNPLVRILYFFSQVVRIKILYYHRKLFFADLDNQYTDDFQQEEEQQNQGLVATLLKWGSSPTGRRWQYMLSSALVYTAATVIGSIICTPVDALTIRMFGNPSVYGPLGPLGTVRLIYREEGVLGFFRGIVANTIFIWWLYLDNITEDSVTGKPPL
jgi:hypothetical protein